MSTITRTQVYSDPDFREGTGSVERKSTNDLIEGVERLKHEIAVDAARFYPLPIDSQFAVDVNTAFELRQTKPR